ncbi:MAG: DUF4922 domain-containing protein [Bacteroidota bacterium]|nr:DUF4922 domain-containing protein [Bacteroidota bacterium]
MATQQEIDKFVHDQLSVWPEMAAAFRALKGVRVRQMPLGGLLVNLQCNPDRISSTTADVTPEVIAARPCPICADHRPENQHFIKLEGRKHRKYDLIVNRFPIFPQHFVIVREVHEPQSIWNRYVDMLDMTEHLPGCVIFYNGPESGASIPDHLHFQAARKGYMPLERSADRLLAIVSQTEGHVVPDSIAADLEYVASVQDAQLFHYKHFSRGVFCLRATTAKSMAKMFYRLLDCAPFLPGEGEPRFNAFSWRTDGEYRALVVLRSESRSHHYFATGEEHFTIGPGCADMAGCFILPDPNDFERITPEILREVVDEVSISEETEKLILWRLVRQQPRIEVGIMSGPEITFEIISDGAGPQRVSYREGKIDYGGTLYDELYFEAQTISTLFAEPSFKLFGVKIGKDFHWERLQEQTFAGTLKFIVENGAVTAVNIIGLEDYLLSVISSEMRASASLEFLKAHAVISRSWAVAQLRSRHAHSGEIPFAAPDTPSLVTWLENKKPDHVGHDDRIVKWFDHDDHKHYDLCADDHCQRYQGLTLAIGENVRTAIDATWGQTLRFDGEVCDTRFSKCCGGLTERFSTCWEDKDVPYLPVKEDPWCNTDDKAVLGQVLNDYDLETPDLYRSTEEYNVEELSDLVRERSGIDIGTLTALTPLERGGSGRIKLLRFEGTKGSFEAGKELIIRRFLSKSHLKSSAFDAEFTADGHVILHGSGWGHGVGLCQVAAANLAAHGHTYQEILAFYYPGSELSHEQ